ncbi:metal-dependent hydrolase [Candidatus Woesearchaeota archaeon]|nr:metal-dependent hydrolase [Candidatus Woesearchaeota archaeon]
MMFKTHAAFGLLIAISTFYYFSNINKFLFIFVVFVSSVFLDIDEKHSNISHKLKPLSTIISFIFKHRGFVHSLLFIILFSATIFIFLGNYYIPFIIGALSHLFLDALTPAGIKLFYPFNIKIHGFFRTGSFFDYILFFLILVLIFFTGISKMGNYISLISIFHSNVAYANRPRRLYK